MFENYWYVDLVLENTPIISGFSSLSPRYT